MRLFFFVVVVVFKSWLKSPKLFQRPREDEAARGWSFARSELGSGHLVSPRTNKLKITR